MFMRNLVLTLGMLALVGCGGSGGDGPPQVGTNACTNDAQKQFVWDAMNDIYFWNTSLPASVDLSAHASPESLLEYLKSFSPLSVATGEPVDRFSYITSAAADAAFFGEGEFEGFGFGGRFEAADDYRLTRALQGSPAELAGFERGQRIIELDGRTIADIEANEGIGAMFDMDPLQFTIRRPDNSEFTVTLAQDIVTIDPLPQWRVIDTATGSVGYMEMATFISTADPVFDTIFGQFQAASITDLIIDLRYNGGGLVSTTELLGDYVGGASEGLVFSRTLFNANNANFNSTEFFEQVATSLNLSRLVIIATQGTASASELITNSMIPHVEVRIVGDRTFGKPVGQVGAEFCEKLLRPTSFESVNSLNDGGYFDGLPVDCPAADDILIPVGADNDPNVVASLEYFATGGCPIVSLPGGQQSIAASLKHVRQPPLRGPAHREFANVN